MMQFIFLIVELWGVPTSPADSLRKETIHGKLFIIHQVDAKETLYGISQRYNAPIKKIIEFNSTADTGLSIGQILKIPFVAPPAPYRKKYHEVQPNETLYSIATRYGLSDDKLKSMNNLTDASIHIGQKLRIHYEGRSSSSSTTTTQAVLSKGYHKVAPQETLYSLSLRYNTTVRELKQWNNITGSNLRIGQIILVSDVGINQKRQKDKIKNTINSKNKSINISENIIGADEIKEFGLAKLIDGATKERKYLALHHKAPIGAILKVRNRLNNREVFVRVIGALPSPSTTGKVIIKVSKSAFNRLSGHKSKLDSQLKIEVTYYK